jgi:hypothetical protein
MRLFSEFVAHRETNEMRFFSVESNDGKSLESQAYRLINLYHKDLADSSRQQGEKDDDIHHDIIKKTSDHKRVIDSLAELFSRIYKLEKNPEKLKSSFFSDTIFEKVARYAKRKLGYHADDIGERLRVLDPTVLDHLYDIWRPGSWVF